VSSHPRLVVKAPCCPRLVCARDGNANALDAAPRNGSIPARLTIFSVNHWQRSRLVREKECGGLPLLSVERIRVDQRVAHSTSYYRRESSSRREDTMNIILWVPQVLLAAAFLAHGLMFLAPPPDIAVLMNAMLPRWFQVFLGVAEVLAAIGLTLPGLTRILPEFVPAAAAGVMIVTVSATVLHLSRGEHGSVATTFVLLLMATFVAYGRWRRLPIPRR